MRINDLVKVLDNSLLIVPVTFCVEHCPLRAFCISFYSLIPTVVP